MTRLLAPPVLSLAVVFAALILPIHADVPGFMNYQGRLTDSDGDPAIDTQHNVTFRIYDQFNNVIWEETHVVYTTGGQFSVQLGSNGSPLTQDVFSHPQRWLGIAVEGDPELSPRTQLNTAPYAFKVGSVQSLDIINEPGVAAYVGDYYMYLDDSTYDVICSLTINCPAEGYVMAVAHGRIATLPQHTGGTDSYAMVGISDIATSLPGNQDLDFHIDSAAPTGTYSIPFGMTSMFTVSTAGPYTYYMIGFEHSGSISVADMQFNLVYFPTAYGTVDPVPPPAGKRVGDGSTWFDGPGPAKGDSEQAKLEAMDIPRLERELSNMKARIEVIQQQIDSCRTAQSGYRR